MKTARKLELIGTLLILASMVGCGSAFAIENQPTSALWGIGGVILCVVGFIVFIVGRFLD
jgi:hypothetical protein